MKSLEDTALPVSVKPSPRFHLYDPRIQHGYIVWHSDPLFEAVVSAIVGWARPGVFVETGTHMGWTSMYVARKWPRLRIRTVEVDPEYHRLSSENLAPFGVTPDRGDSVPWLRQVVSSLDLSTIDPHLGCEPLPLFWLDAHWYDPPPLREECKIVATLDKYVAIVDDFFCASPDFEGDVFTDGSRCSLPYVADILGGECWRPAYPSWPGTKGYGIFIKGLGEFPGHEYLKKDVLG